MLLRYSACCMIAKRNCKIIILFLSTSQVVHEALCINVSRFDLIFHQIAFIDAEKQMLEARIGELTSDNKVLHTQLKEKDECENNEKHE